MIKKFDLVLLTYFIFQALPSPTTGTFPLPPLNHESLVLNSVTREDGDKVSGADSFRFKPYGNFESLPGCCFGNQVTTQCFVRIV